MIDAPTRLYESHSVRELYEIQRGNREEWGIDSYHAPKTIQYIKKPHLFPKAKRHDAYSEALQRQKWPGPSTYSPDLEKSLKKNWLSKGGRLSKCTKMTILEEVMKNERKKPGPGYYFKEPISKKVHLSVDQHKRIRETFLDEVEVLASEGPSSWKYDPYDKLKSHNSAIKWVKPKEKSKKEKDKVGPGCYENYMGAKQYTLSSPLMFSMAKSQSPSYKDLKSKTSRFGSPGVGMYSDAFYMMSISGQAKKNTSSGKGHVSKSKRYLDDIIRLGKTVPGPGSYNVEPQLPNLRRKN